MPKTPKLGRPPIAASKRRNVLVSIYVSEKTRARWVRDATRAGLTLSVWARERIESGRGSATDRRS